MFTFVSTILGGVLIFALSEMFRETILKPALNLKRSIAKIQKTFVMHEHSIGVAYESRVKAGDLVPRTAKAADELTSASAQLFPAASRIACYGIARRLFGLPTKENIARAVTEVRGIRNYLDSRSDDYFETISRKRQRLFKFLRVDDPMVGDRARDQAPEY